jgi:N-acetylated-alpha-linked acidic dipeptidase
LLLAIATPPTSPRGFLRAGVESERRWESRYQELPDAAVIRESDRALSARPHHLGSAADEKNARWILAKFREWGLDARIETFYALFPTPRERRLEMVSPSRFVAALAETPVEGDPTSSQTAEQLPTYNAYSIDGDVTAPLVYVNYGIPADYERLERLGIDVRGKIVLARYGGSWRGIKPKVAAERGAVGCLIYSDPRDDGYFEGDVYPQGAWRPEQGVQRGSVADMPLYPGDPLTPGIGAVRPPDSIDLSRAKTLTKIPVLPISYGDARPLLAALTGPVAPSEWRGALPLTYHLGPGPATVHLRLAFDWRIVPVHDVIARIPGAVWPDEWVIRGNHHDAWVNGASDPTSGQAALLEEARSLALLRREGWRPKRTIVFCAWDGEEEGLFGSTEWVETHADELRRKAVAYLNTDSNGRGFFSAGGSHTLEALVNQVALEIPDPEKKIPVGLRTRAHKIDEAKTAEERRRVRERRDWPLDALGSGSDFTPFLQHLGIATLNFAYEGESGGGVYHSIYDDFSWYTRFADPDFAYGRALAQTAGTTLLRLADADLLPLDFRPFADAISRYVREVEELAKKQREDRDENATRIGERLAEALADSRETFAPLREESPVPEFDFGPLEKASAELASAAAEYESGLVSFESADGGVDPAAMARVNALLRDVERTLTREEGLPGRPWFKHVVYAPGFYTGYDVKTLPLVREALEQKQWSEVSSAIAATSEALQRAAAHVRRAAAALSSR